MSRNEFLAALKRLRINQREFAAIVRVHQATIYHWGTAQSPFPFWVGLLLNAWEQAHGAIPGWRPPASGVDDKD